MPAKAGISGCSFMHVRHETPAFAGGGDEMTSCFSGRVAWRCFLALPAEREERSAGFFLSPAGGAAIDGGMTEKSRKEYRNVRPRVALFATCVVNTLRPQAVEAAMRLLRHAGCVVEVPEQGCCGQPAFNAGYEDEARTMGRALLETLAPYDAVVAPSASCAGMVRNHLPELFTSGTAEREAAEALAARTFELCEFLHHDEVTPLMSEWRGGPVLWHDSCASLREVPGAADAALALLERVPGLEVLLPEVETRQTCCGFGGLFSVKVPEVSAELGKRKLDTMLELAPDASPARPLVITGVDMGCLMHLQGVAEARGLPVKAMHAAEILAGGDPVEGLSGPTKT